MAGELIVPVRLKFFEEGLAVIYNRAKAEAKALGKEATAETLQPIIGQAATQSKEYLLRESKRQGLPAPGRLEFLAAERLLAKEFGEFTKTLGVKNSELKKLNLRPPELLEPGVPSVASRSRTEAVRQRLNEERAARDQDKKAAEARRFQARARAAEAAASAAAAAEPPPKVRKKVAKKAAEIIEAPIGSTVYRKPENVKPDPIATGLQNILARARTEMAALPPEGRTAGALQAISGRTQTRAREFVERESPLAGIELSKQLRAATRTVARGFTESARELGVADSELKKVDPRKLTDLFATKVPGAKPGAKAEAADPTARIEAKAREAAGKRDELFRVRARANELRDLPAEGRVRAEEATSTRLANIEKQKVLLGEENIKIMAEEKVRRERVTRAVAAEVRAQTTPQDKKDIAQSAIDQRKFDLEHRSLVAQGADPTLEALVKAQEAAVRREVSIEQSKLELQTETVRKIAEEKVRRDELNRAVAAQVRQQTNVRSVAADQLGQRSVDLQTRALVAQGTDVGAEARTATIEGVTQRRIAIARTKLEQDEQIVREIATEKLELEKLNQAVRAEVRARTDVGAIAADRLGARRQAEQVRLSELGQEGPADYARAGSIAIEERRRKTEVALAEQNELRTTVGRELVATEQRVAQLTAESAATLAELKSTDTALIAANVRAARAREEGAARTVLAGAHGGIGEADPAGGRDALIARASALRRVEADTKAIAAINATTTEEIELRVQKKVAEVGLQNAIRIREKEILKQAIAEGKFDATSTKFQRLQSRLSPGQGRTPESFSTIGQFAGQKLATTVGYAAAGMATGALIFGVKNAIDQAEELQQTFTLLQAQLDGMGKRSEFGRISDEVRSIAADTGVATEQVAEFSARLIGVFGSGPGDGVGRAMTETRAAMQLAVVTGIDFKNILQDLVPTATQFGVGIEEIGNLAVGIRERFGIAEGALTDFLGRTAAVATQAGLKMEEMAVFGSVAANSLGKDMGTIADLFAKVIPGLSGAQDKIYSVYQSKAGTADLIDPMAEAFGKGDTGAVFKQIIGSYDKLDNLQKKQLINSIAERREAPLLAALLSKNKDIVLELANGHLTAAETAGKLAGRFRNLQDTAKNAEDRIKEAFNQLGEAIFNSGAGDAFYDIASAIKAVVSAAGLLFSVFGKLDDLTKPFTNWAGLPEGLLRSIVELALVSALAAKAFGVLGVAKSGDAAASTVASRSLSRLIGVKVADTKATNDDVIAELRLTESRLSGATAATGEAGSVGRLTAAKEAEAGAVWSRSGGYSATAARAAGSGGGAIVWPKHVPLGRPSVSAVTGAPLSETTKYAARDQFLRPLVPTNSAAGFMGLYATPTEAEIAKYGLRKKFLQGATFNPKGVFGRTPLLASGSADAAATAATGAARGASPAGIGGLFVAGGLLVKAVYDSRQGELKKQGEDLATALKKVDLERLKKVRDEHEAEWDTVWDRMGEILFRDDSASTRLKNEIYDKEAAPSMLKAKGITAAGKVPDLAKRLSESNKGELERFLNSSKDLKMAAADAGFEKVEQLQSPLDFITAPFDLKNYTGANAPEVKVTEEGLKAAIPRLQQMVLEHKEGAKEALDKILALQAGQIGLEDINKAADEALAAGKVDEASLLFGGDDQLVIHSFEEAKTRHDLGLSSTAEFLSEMDKQAKILEKQLDGRGEAGRIELNKQKKATEEVRQQALQRRTSFLQNQTSITQSETPKTNQLQIALDDFKKLDKQHQFDALPKLLQDSYDAWQERLDNMTDPIARANAARAGNPIDPQLIRTQFKQQIEDDQAATAGLTEAAELTGLKPEVMIDKIVAIAQANNIAIAEAVHKYYEDVIAGIKAESLLYSGVEMTEDDPTIRRFRKAQAEGEIATGQIISPEKVQETNRKNTRKTELAGILNDQKGALELQAAQTQASRAEDDPIVEANLAVAQAQLDLADAQAKYNEGLGGSKGEVDRAKAAVIRAQKGRVKATEDQTKAVQDSELDIAAALAERDPIKTAQIGLQRAALAAARATDQASRNQAEADRIRAQHQLEDAIAAVFDSQINLAIAVADAAGESVESAQLALKEAQDKLSRALDQGQDPNSAAINDLRADVVAKSAGVRDAYVSEREAEIDFQQQMGQITTEQVIAAYQALLQYPKLTAPMRREIELKIHELMQTAKGDFQFNLPTQLGLPTFYESRRATQTPGGPGNYTDNRQVSIVLNVNNPNDVAAVESALATHLGTNRYAGTGRRYP